jgi:Flp pilus assembly protein TadB
LIRFKRSITPTRSVNLPMVHTISLGAALLIVLLAIVFLFLIGPLGLLVLILAVGLLWYAFGPGSRSVVVSS